MAVRALACEFSAITFSAAAGASAHSASLRTIRLFATDAQARRFLLSELSIVIEAREFARSHVQ
jgi:hypothetical protein